MKLLTKRKYTDYKFLAFFILINFYINIICQTDERSVCSNKLLGAHIQFSTNSM